MKQFNQMQGDYGNNYVEKIVQMCTQTHQFANARVELMQKLSLKKFQLIPNLSQ